MHFHSEWMIVGLKSPSIGYATKDILPGIDRTKSIDARKALNHSVDITDKKLRYLNQSPSYNNEAFDQNGNVIDSRKLQPINIADDTTRVLIKNFKTPNPHKQKNGRVFNSFGRLGFVDDTKGDPDFNPHHEYNMRRMPPRAKMNNSVEDVRSMISPNSQLSEKEHVRRIRQHSNLTQMDNSPMYFTHLTFRRKMDMEINLKMKGQNHKTLV